MSDVIVYVTENETTVQVTESVIETNVTVTEMQVTPEVTEIIVNITPVEVTVYTGNIPDAPANDKTYGRKNNDWVEVTGGGTSVHNNLTGRDADDQHPLYKTIDASTVPEDTPNDNDKVVIWTASGWIYSLLSDLKQIIINAASLIYAPFSHGDANHTETYVKDNDIRLSDSRTPLQHGNEAHSETYITAADVTANETDPIFSNSEAANFVSGDKSKLDSALQSVVVDGITITGTGVAGDPLVATQSGTGDVTGPAGATADNIAVFDGATGKKIKDGGKKISDLALVAHTHTIAQVDPTGSSAGTPQDTDYLSFWQGAYTWFKITFANFKAYLKAYFDGIYATLTSVTQMDMSGLVAWGGSGDYYSMTAGGTFTVLRAGSGYIKSVAKTWAGGENVALTANKGYFIVITDTNTLDAIDVTSLLDSDVAVQHANFRAFFQNNIILFSVWYDGIEYIAVEQGHPYNYESTITAHDHVRFGSVFISTGAVLTFLNAAARTVKLVGNDAIDDHGVVSDILDSGGAAISIIGIWRNNAGLSQRYHRRNFTVTGVTTAPTAGAVYTHNGSTYTVLFTNAGKTLIEAWGSTWVNQPLASGTLTKVSGTGDASITFTSVATNRVVPASYLVTNSPVPLTTSGLTRYGIYAIYTLVSDKQTPTTAAPAAQFFALMSATAYVSISAAEQSLGTAAYPSLTQFVMPSEIQALEPVLTGFVIVDGADRSIEITSNAGGFISGVRSFKQTPTQSGSSGAVSVTAASNVTTATANFDYNLTTADTDLQKALDTLDELETVGGRIYLFYNY